MEAIAENKTKRIFAENEAELLNECMKSVLLGMQSLDVVEKVAVGELNAYVKQQMGEYAALSERVSDRMGKRRALSRFVPKRRLSRGEKGRFYVGEKPLRHDRP